MQLVEVGLKIHIGQISIQMQVPQNEFQRDIQENLDAFYQMLDTCG